MPYQYRFDEITTERKVNRERGLVHSLVAKGMSFEEISKWLRRNRISGASPGDVQAMFSGKLPTALKAKKKVKKRSRKKRKPTTNEQ